jgi:predicted metal-dependent peptidase
MSIQGSTAVTKDTRQDFLSEEPMPVDNKVVEKLVVARVGLLMTQPFWGNLATRLTLIDATHIIPTAATDGRKFYYNQNFVRKLTIRECQFLFGHEVGHCVLDHFSRKGDRDSQIWNISGDYVINGMLVEGKVGDVITVVKPLLDARYKDMFTEEVYDNIYQQANKIDLTQLFTLDEHLPESEDGDGQGQGSGDGDSDGPLSKMPSISKEDAKKLKDEFREAVLSAAKAAGAGNVPGMVKRLIKEFTEPKINWRELIRQQIQSLIKSDFTWSRPNKKTWSSGVWLPGSKPEETIDVHVCIDTSGSISEKMLKDFLSEVQGIMDQYQDFKVRIWCFDTDIHADKEYDESNRYDLVQYEPAGGGGTDFMANWEYMRRNDIQPKKLIMFTDGYPFGAWGEPEFCDTVFIIHGNDKIEPPFGTWAYYDPKEGVTVQ